MFWKKNDIVMKEWNLSQESEDLILVVIMPLTTMDL